MLIMEKDGVEWVERSAIIKEWQKIEQYIAFLKELGESLHLETLVDTKIEQIEDHKV